MLHELDPKFVPTIAILFPLDDLAILFRAGGKIDGVVGFTTATTVGVEETPFTTTTAVSAPA
jgi:hypothetical protein